MTHECNKEEMLTEMSGDIKTLLAEFKSMNGALRDTKGRFDKHEDESKLFRKQVSELWAGVHFSKYIIMIMFGSGLMYAIIKEILFK